MAHNDETVLRQCNPADVTVLVGTHVRGILLCVQFQRLQLFLRAALRDEHLILRYTPATRLQHNAIIRYAYTYIQQW